MRYWPFALAFFLPALLCAAEPEKQATTPPQEMTAEELSQATEDFWDRLEKKVRSEPGEWKALTAAHGPVMKKHLVQQFKEAKSVVFTEISHGEDFDFPEGAAPETPPQYEYASVTLTDEQRKDAITRLEAMDGTTGKGAICFYPHHRMDLTGADGKVSHILICRECNRILWKGLVLDSPGEVPRILSEIMKSAGLDLSKDWSKLAMERWAEENPTPSGDKAPVK